MTLKYLSKYGAGLAGAVIMGTGYVPEAAARAGLTLARGEEAVRGGHYRSKTIQGLAFGEPYKRYDMTGQDVTNSWLTKDPEIVKFYYGEPRCQFMFTVNGYQGLFEAIVDCENPENIANVPKELPPRKKAELFFRNYFSVPDFQNREARFLHEFVRAGNGYPDGCRAQYDG